MGEVERNAVNYGVRGHFSAVRVGCSFCEWVGGGWGELGWFLFFLLFCFGFVVRAWRTSAVTFGSGLGRNGLDLNVHYTVSHAHTPRNPFPQLNPSQAPAGSKAFRTAPMNHTQPKRSPTSTRPVYGNTRLYRM